MQFRLVATSAIVALGIASPVSAADMEAGKTIATAVCSACHGANGVSVAPAIPNLAGQRAAYIEKQLDDYKSEKRKHQIMSALAGQLDKTAMADVAAYYAAQPGPAVGAENSKPPANFIAKRVSMPASLAGFTHYMTFNEQARKELRKVYANRVAIEAAKAGQPLPDGSVIVVEAFKAMTGTDGTPTVGADGLYVAGERAGYTAMERQAGWGADFAELIRNDNWHYGVFAPDGSPRPNVNQASCLACHKPLAKDSYLFSMKELRAAASK
jgi:cytochrome c553